MLTMGLVSQVRGAVNGQLFSLSNSGNTKTFREGISQTSSSEMVYRSFSSLPSDVYYWVLPGSFRGDKVRGQKGCIHTHTHSITGGKELSARHC